MVNVDKIGQALVKEVKKEIIRMDLIGLGDYLSSIGYRVSGNKITLFSSSKYAEALEYGTYDFGRLTKETSPKTMTAQQAKGLKKKDMTNPQGLPKGMIAFAPFRRVVYNDKLINQIVLENLE